MEYEEIVAVVDALSPEAMAHHSKPIARPGRRWQKRCTGCSTASRPKAGTPACRSSRPIRRAATCTAPIQQIQTKFGFEPGHVIEAAKDQQARWRRE